MEYITGDLVKWYKKGFVDELRGSSSVESDNSSENKAYSIGATHAASGVELDLDKNIKKYLIEKLKK